MVKNLPVSVGDVKCTASIPGSVRSPGEQNDNPKNPVFLPGKFYGQRSLADYSPSGREEESDVIEGLSTYVYTNTYVHM